MLLRDNIYSVIRHAILSLEFQPGQELREQHLAERYRVSRSPIRDALLRLGQEGFVTVLPRQGYRVNQISIRDVEALYDLRLLMEPACAARAARADDAMVASLDRFRDFGNKSGPVSEFLDYNSSFHSAVADLCGNPRMAVIEHNLIEECERLAKYTAGFATASKLPHVDDHKAIIDAIQAHDAQEAARLAHEHLTARMMPIIAALRDNIEMWTEAVAAMPRPE